MVKPVRKSAHSRGQREEILVVGGGPAGLSLATEFARLGRSTTLVDAHLGKPWGRSYGSFLSDLRGCGVDSTFVRIYERPEVRVEEDSRLVVGESYARLDTSLLQSLLLKNAERAGVALISGDVRSVELEATTGAGLCEILADPGPGHHGSEPTLLTKKVQLVVNAGGGRELLRADRGRPPSLFQTALGYWVNASSHPFEPGEMSLMDFRPVDDGDPPTFLYAMPETGDPRGPGCVFVQETNLVSEEPVSMHLLRERLHKRLELMGLTECPIIGTERCLIPMGGSLPHEDSPLLPFGAAAGLVHPATGYQLARALRLAPQVAEAAALELNESPRKAIRAGVHVMWPRHTRRAFQLYEAGARAISGLSAAQTRTFVHEFFSLPNKRAIRFMTGDMQPEEIIETMWRVFTAASGAVRAGLLRGGATASARILAQQFS
jgi:lycopene beta-cyclase